MKGPAMYPSSSLCREQENAQRHRAATTPLENVRVVAERAAIAWGNEAVAAEKREARQQRTRAIAAMIAVQKQMSCEQDGGSLSENPDRGFADS